MVGLKVWGLVQLGVAQLSHKWSKRVKGGALTKTNVVYLGGMGCA